MPRKGRTMEMFTITFLPLTDVAAGMTVAYTFDGGGHAQSIENIERNEDGSAVLWLAAGHGLFVRHDEMVAVEIH
jgi:hypothetical protein